MSIGNIMEIRFVKGTLYDKDSKEIEVPEGYSVCYGNGKMAFVKTKDDPEYKFVWRDPFKEKNNG